MEYQELLERYNVLLEEIKRLKNENRQLKANLGLRAFQPFQNIPPAVQQEKDVYADVSNAENHGTDVNNSSDSLSKIRLFMSLSILPPKLFFARAERTGLGSAVVKCSRRQIIRIISAGKADGDEENEYWRYRK